MVDMITTLLLAAVLSQSTDVPITPSPAWKNQIAFPKDVFEGVNLSPGLARWVKFVSFVDDPGVIYFQDGKLYPFHYDFAVNELDPFLGFSNAQFDAITLLGTNREAVLGAVLLPPDKNPDGFLIGIPPEFGMQLVSLDPLDSQLVVDIFNGLVASVQPAFGSAQGFYFPTFEQSQAAQSDQAFFAANGIEISGSERWIEGDSIYSEGWAVGRLVNVAAANIETAYATGLIGPMDILLTDGIPAELPPLAGIFSTAPSTPNSHVAILAQSFDIPFAFLSEVNDQDAALALVGQRIFARAYSPVNSDGNPAGILLVDLEAQLDSATIDALAALHDPTPLVLPPLTQLGTYGVAVDGLDLSSVAHVGGKAANYSLLRDVIPANSPVAVALTLDLWTDYLDQVMPGGMTLRAEIDLALGGFSWPPTDIGATLGALSMIRDRIEDDTLFSLAEQSAVLALLTDPTFGFDSNAKLRFRSSTNVEDTDQFSGAGLYDSKSGCLADDLDGDTVGPSSCDPDSINEKGVFRAIRKVFASFYNDNAFLERLRHSVDEEQVGMGVLVHHSYPDEFEVANGVATLTRGGFSERVLFATQPGAASVTNPDGDALPELVQVQLFLFGPQATMLQGSSLLPLGASAMDFTTDYEAFAELFVDVADEYELRTGKTSFVLDFEFKKLNSGGAALPAGGLVVKQFREIPQASSTPSVTPFLLNLPTELCTFQAEFGGSLFSYQRLKTRLWIETQNTWLTEGNLAAGSLYTDYWMRYTDGYNVLQSTGQFDQLAGFAHSYDPLSGLATDSWDFIQGDSLPRRMTLETPAVPTLVAPARCPILTQRDFGSFGRNLSADYGQEVMDNFVVGGPPALASSGTTTLRLCSVGTPSPLGLSAQPAVQASAVPVTGLANRASLESLAVASGLAGFGFTNGQGVEVTTNYVGIGPTPGFQAGFTVNLDHFVETEITGLTSHPILLTSEFSQTYKPGHHNFSDFFLFCPELDENLPQYQKDELAAQDIYAIYIEGRAFSLSPDKTDQFELLSAETFGQLCASGVLERKLRPLVAPEISPVPDGR